MKRAILVPALAWAALGGGCSHEHAAVTAETAVPQPAVATIAAEFKGYRKMTAQEVFVNPELAMLCVGASGPQVEAARKTKGPHAHTAILVYMNDRAAEAFARGGGAYPVGAVVVKQKTLLPTRNQPGAAMSAIGHGIGGMVKRPAGFDSTHGDWEYFYFEEPTRIEAGRMASCRECHAGAQKTDYVFGMWAGEDRKS